MCAFPTVAHTAGDPLTGFQLAANPEAHFLPNNAQASQAKENAGSKSKLLADIDKLRSDLVLARARAEKEEKAKNAALREAEEERLEKESAQRQVLELQEKLAKYQAVAGPTPQPPAPVTDAPPIYQMHFPSGAFRYVRIFGAKYGQAVSSPPPLDVQAISTGKAPKGDGLYLACATKFLSTLLIHASIAEQSMPGFDGRGMWWHENPQQTVDTIVNRVLYALLQARNYAAATHWTTTVLPLLLCAIRRPAPDSLLSTVSAETKGLEALARGEVHHMQLQKWQRDGLYDKPTCIYMVFSQHNDAQREAIERALLAVNNAFAEAYPAPTRPKISPWQVKEHSRLRAFVTYEDDDRVETQRPDENRGYGRGGGSASDEPSRGRGRGRGGSGRREY